MIKNWKEEFKDLSNHKQVIFPLLEEYTFYELFKQNSLILDIFDYPNILNYYKHKISKMDMVDAVTILDDFSNTQLYLVLFSTTSKKPMFSRELLLWGLEKLIGKSSQFYSHYFYDFKFYHYFYIEDKRLLKQVCEQAIINDLRKGQWNLTKLDEDIVNYLLDTSFFTVYMYNVYLPNVEQELKPLLNSRKNRKRLLQGVENFGQVYGCTKETIEKLELRFSKLIDNKRILKKINKILLNYLTIEQEQTKQDLGEYSEEVEEDVLTEQDFEEIEASAPEEQFTSVDEAKQLLDFMKNLKNK